MLIESPEFEDGGDIPRTFTGDGRDISPELRWNGVPPEAVELLLIVDDPDAPNGTWVHWVIAGLNPKSGGLAEGAVPAGAVQGINDFGTVGWGGPSPPRRHGPHRYFFTLYALSGPSGLRDGVTADGARGATKDMVLAQAQMMGRYERR